MTTSTRSSARSKTERVLHSSIAWVHQVIRTVLLSALAFLIGLGGVVLGGATPAGAVSSQVPGIAAYDSVQHLLSVSNSTGVTVSGVFSLQSNGFTKVISNPYASTSAVAVDSKASTVFGVTTVGCIWSRSELDPSTTFYNCDPGVKFVGVVVDPSIGAIYALNANALYVINETNLQVLQVLQIAGATSIALDPGTHAVFVAEPYNFAVVQVGYSVSKAGITWALGNSVQDQSSPYLLTVDVTHSTVYAVNLQGAPLTSWIEVHGSITNATSSYVDSPAPFTMGPLAWNPYNGYLYDVSKDGQSIGYSSDGGFHWAYTRLNPNSATQIVATQIVPLSANANALVQTYNGQIMVNQVDTMLNNVPSTAILWAGNATQIVSTPVKAGQVTVPGAPTGVTAQVATPSSASAQVTFTAPASNGGSSITSYTVTATDATNPNGSTLSASGPSSPITVTGLTDGDSYTFTVTAKNSAGSSAASSASSAVTPLDAPQAPANVVAQTGASIGDAAASVSFSPPTMTGGSSVTSYTVTAHDQTAPGSPGDGTTCVAGPNLSSNSYACTVVGLTDGDTYSFTVTATNDIGTSVPSSPSATAIPMSDPDPVTDLTAVATDTVGTVQTHFTVPNVHGESLLGFIVNAKGPNDGHQSHFADGLGNTTFTNLTPGQWVFQETTIADPHWGAGSNQVIVTVGSAPSAPASVAATAGDGSATVSVAAPASDGGSSVTGYTVTAQDLMNPGRNGDGATCTIAASANPLSCTVTGLSNGDQYAFTATATNAIGTSPSSVASQFVTPEPFAANVQVTSSSRSLLVSWSPSSVGSIDSYVVYTTSGDGTSCTTTDTTCTISWLKNGTPETVQIDAYDQDGNLLSSVQDGPVAAAAAPLAPINVNAVAADHSAVISWSPADPQGSPVTSYTVTDAAGNTCTTAATSCTVTGLNPGDSDTFTVTATNAVGTSPASLVSNAVTISARPAPPTDVSLTPLLHSLRVTWTASATNGGSAITTYIVKDTFGNSCMTDQTECTLSGITSRDADSVLVVAINGDGLSSGVSDAVAAVAGNVADAPTNPYASPMPTGVFVQWQAPSFTGGVPITSYTVISSDGQTCTTTETACEISNLVGGVPETFVVHANNSFGASANSDSVMAVPYDRPTKVTGVVATPLADGSILVQWNPANGAGLPITSYMVQGAQGGCSSIWLSCVVTGLNLGSDYQFQVVALNSFGPSDPSAPSSPVLAAALPGAPTNVTVIGGDQSAMISWDPSAPNGSAITSYTVTATLLSGPSLAPTPTFVCQTAQVTCAVGGLANGQTYAFTVTATNGIGQSAPSTQSSPVVPAGAPAAPTGLVASVGDGSVTLSWNPSVTNGTPVTSYTVSSNAGSSCATADGTTTSCVVTGLTNGQAATFYVMANSLAGSSLAAVIVATPVAVPQAPTAVKVVAGNGAALVSFQPPLFNGGSKVTSYVVQAADLSNDGMSAGSCATNAAGSCRVTGLQNGDTYAFSVVAINVAGPSQPSPSVQAVPAGPPSAPTGVTAVTTSGQATVSWTAAAANGSPVTGYTVSNGAGLTCTTTTTSCTVRGLTNGQSYTFVVRAANALGSSPLSVASAVVVPFTIPGAPMSVSAASGNGSATISWNKPRSNGGAAIATYLVSDGTDTCSTSQLSCTVFGLVNGATYSFTVVAINAAGASTPSGSVQVTPATIAGAPTITGISSVASGLQVSFQAPSVNGGSPVASYLVSTDGGMTFAPVGKGDLFGTTMLLTGLNPGTSYSVVIEAVNAVGASAPSNLVTATYVTTASAPKILSVTAQLTTLMVKYQGPASTGGADIAAYQYSLDGGSTWNLATYGTPQTLRISGLKRHTTYRLRLRAVNAAGIGVASTVKVVRTN